MSEGDTRHRRVAIAGIAGALTLMWAVGAVTSEPYPALIFPSFANIPTEGVVEKAGVRLLVIESETSSVQLEPGELFHDSLDSFHRDMIDSMVASDPIGSGELEAWFSRRAQAQLGWSECVRAVEVVEATGEPAPDGTRVIEEIHNRIDFPTCAGVAMIEPELQP